MSVRAQPCLWGTVFARPGRRRGPAGRCLQRSAMRVVPSPCGPPITVGSPPVPRASTATHPGRQCDVYQSSCWPSARPRTSHWPPRDHAERLNSRTKVAASGGAWGRLQRRVARHAGTRPARFLGPGCQNINSGNSCPPVMVIGQNAVTAATHKVSMATTGRPPRLGPPQHPPRAVRNSSTTASDRGVGMPKGTGAGKGRRRAAVGGSSLPVRQGQVNTARAVNPALAEVGRRSALLRHAGAPLGRVRKTTLGAGDGERGGPRGKRARRVR